MLIDNNNKFEDNYYTKNRKLKIEEYDDYGNIIDTIEFSQEDLWDFCIFKNNYSTGFDIARKSDREYFSGEKLEISKKIINLIDDKFFNIITIKRIEDLFEKYTIEQINFAINFKDYNYNISNYAFYGEEENFVNNLKFIDVLEYMKLKNGFWYAKDSIGNIGMAYLKEPTRKQLKYQLNKNGKYIVFFNFTDCKEYSVNENELKIIR